MKYGPEFFSATTPFPLSAGPDENMFRGHPAGERRDHPMLRPERPAEIHAIQLTPPLGDLAHVEGLSRGGFRQVRGQGAARDPARGQHR